MVTKTTKALQQPQNYQQEQQVDNEKIAMAEEIKSLRYENYLASLDNDRNFKVVLLQHLQAIKDGIDEVRFQKKRKYLDFSILKS